ncbi:MAG: fructose-bisphosphatase class I, partial [Erythrobacter cryptus]
MRRKTLTQFLIEQQRSEQIIGPELRLLVELVARACKSIGHVISKGELGDVLVSLETENIQGEV